MRPLEGIKVLDFTQVHAGSQATRLLADFGAEVIKVERPGVGDLGRYFPPVIEDNSAIFSLLSRGKKSISLDFSTPEGKKAVEKLIAEVDVLCENFKFGNMERMGLSYEEVKKISPNIIYASLSGFGQTGPLKKNIGLDLQLQTISGFMDRTGFKDGPPTMTAPAIGDHTSGTFMANAIMLALINKKLTGEGQYIDISIFDSLFSLVEAAAATYSLEGDMPKRAGNQYPSVAPYDAFEAKDGYVSIALGSDSQWVKFCNLMGLEDICHLEEYSSNERRGKNHLSSLKKILNDKTKTMGKFEIEKLLSDAKLPCGAVVTIKEAIESEQIKARDMLIPVYDKAMQKDVLMPGIGIKLSLTPGYVKESAPLLGEHTQQYLKEVGYRDEEIQALLRDKVIEIAETEALA